MKLENIFLLFSHYSILMVFIKATRVLRNLYAKTDETIIFRDYGILSEIENIQEHSTRSRRGPRGLTPTSTDSSEKENFNPNRMKKQTNKKKKSSKKL